MDAPVAFVRGLLPAIVNLHAIVPKSHPSAQILDVERMGSGVVVDTAGLVLTVNYAVMGARTLEVTFATGRPLRGEIVAQDFEVGLALVRVKGPVPAAATFAERPLELGDEVAALVSTGPRERRAGNGLVTYLGEFEAYWEYLLEHAIGVSAGNPGFGGGGLFTRGGRLAGIVYVNLGELARSALAIPVECYRDHAEELLRHGRVVSRPRRAWLGVFAYPVEEGVVLAGVVPGGPGDKGGLREGDLIVSLNAEEVGSRRDLYLNLWRHEPGERLVVEVMRDRRLRRLEVTGGDRAHFYRQP